MAFLHAQDVVQAQLLLPALDEEAVGVEQEQQGEQGDDEDPEAHHGGDGGAAVHGLLVDAQGEGGDAVEHEDDSRPGEQVGQGDPPVVFQVAQGQLAVQSPGHVTPPPVPRKVPPGCGR